MQISMRPHATVNLLSFWQQHQYRDFVSGLLQSLAEAVAVKAE